MTQLAILYDVRSTMQAEVQSNTDLTAALHALALCVLQERRRGKVYKGRAYKKLPSPGSSTNAHEVCYSTAPRNQAFT